MTSLIKADNIAKADGTSEVATEYVTRGSAKAFVSQQMDGSRLTVASLNVSSTTDNAFGNWDATFATAFSSSAYATASGGTRSVPSTSGSAGQQAIDIQSASVARLRGFDSATGSDDWDLFDGVFFGDLA